MQDKALYDVDRTLASTIVVLTASVRHAESLVDQKLADDLHELLRSAKRIHHGIGSRGQTYKPL